jgi:F-type H+-transporting ATPase subunit a
MAIQTNQNNIEQTAEPVQAVSTEVKHEVTLYAEPIAHFGSFTITNALFTGWITVAAIAVFVFAMRSKLREVPKGLQNVFEVILEGALSLCDQVTNSRKISEKVFPLAFSVFTFIIVSNWFGLLPLGGFGS